MRLASCMALPDGSSQHAPGQMPCMATPQYRSQRIAGSGLIVVGWGNGEMRTRMRLLRMCVRVPRVYVCCCARARVCALLCVCVCGCVARVCVCVCRCRRGVTPRKHYRTRLDTAQASVCVLFVVCALLPWMRQGILCAPAQSRTWRSHSWKIVSAPTAAAGSHSHGPTKWQGRSIGSAAVQAQLVEMQAPIRDLEMQPAIHPSHVNMHLDMCLEINQVRG